MQQILCRVQLSRLLESENTMNKCQITGCVRMDGTPSYASFRCSQCHRQICLHRHLRRRKIEGQFNYVCVECLPSFDRARKAQKKSEFSR